MIGNIMITLATAASVFSVAMYYLTYKGNQNTLKWARIGYHVMTALVVVASALLLHAILNHQFEYKYVFNYSGSGLPTGLLMSTFYAGQEGSFMLWLLFTAIIGLVLQDYTSKRGDLEYRVMMIFTISAAFLLIMVNPALKNPFSTIWSDPTFISTKYLNTSLLSLPFLQQFFFQDPGSNESFVKVGSELVGLLKANGIAISDFIIQGKGLNPLLQNFWMQIHPPILFVGFAMSAVPFAFAFSALLKNDYQDWVKQALPWLTSSMAVLGFAIMLGGYWAYGVLGWGGYWGWDPVENASLVPWIIGVAGVHTMLVQKKTKTEKHPGRFLKINLILSILTYVLVLYSTFLTRSGILGDASVHSFVAPGAIVFLFLLLFIGTFTLMGIIGIIYRWKSLEDMTVSNENVMSRELALFTGAVTLIASALIILAGTSAPIFSTTVEIKFYNELNLPIAIIMGLLNGFSLILKWKLNDGKNIFDNAKLSLVATFILTLLIVFVGGVHELMQILFTISASFTLVANAEVLYRVMKRDRIKAGAYVAHIGIALFMLGIVATSGFTNEKRVDLIKGEPQTVLGQEIMFRGIRTFDQGRKYRFDITVGDQEDQSVVSPVMFVAEFNNSLMREPDILSKITSDFYVSPVSYTEKGSATSDGQKSTLKLNESTDFEGKKILFKKFNFPKEAMAAMMAGEEFQIGALLQIAYNGNIKDVEAIMKSSGGEREFIPLVLEDANLKIDVTSLDASGSLQVVFSNLASGNGVSKEVLTVEASTKPFIGLVWLGTILVTFGFIISTVRRTKESNQ
ncbi:MAG: cytochrome c biogenesis protein CcsA [Bacteroidetes bacterium]|nr:cytochrome c biogenesis protein CcsA [Bacteroidota bacterium]